MKKSIKRLIRIDSLCFLLFSAFLICIVFFVLGSAAAAASSFMAAVLTVSAVFVIILYAAAAAGSLLQLHRQQDEIYGLDISCRKHEANE